jgi:hypothetical protein
MRFSVASFTVLASVSALSLFACGSGSGEGGAGPSGPGAFVGNWSCTVVVAGQSSASTITAVENSDGSITASLSDTGAISCSLKYTVSGSIATVESGQSCSSGGQSLVVKSGTTTVTNAGLNGSLSVAVNGGQATESFTCTKS